MKRKQQKSTNNASVTDVGQPFEFPAGEGRLYKGVGELLVKYYAVAENQLVIDLYAGEVDVYSAAALRNFLIDAINHGYIHLIIKLDGIEFLDSTGLGVFVGAFKRVLARSRGGYVDIVCDRERILKIFRITGHTKIYRISQSVPQALASRLPKEVADVTPENVDREVDAGDWIPVRLYMAEAQNHERVEAALRALIEEFGLEINYEFPPSYGSYWREFGARFRKRATNTEAADARMVALERSIRLHAVNQRQSVLNKDEAKTVAEFITALEGTANAVIQIGSVILIKYDGTIITRNLSPVELIYYHRDPSSFRDPKVALSTLRAISEIRNGRARGRHQKTGTIHLARSIQPPANESDGELVIHAQCGRTNAPLILEVDGLVSCGACKRILLKKVNASPTPIVGTLP